VYDEYYGLNGKPFQLTPDHRFFFESKAHHRAMAYLRYGLEQGEGFIVITGGIGTGKTMLAQALVSELTGSDILPVQLVNTQVDPEEMLRMVCASFGLAHQGMNKATMLQNLEAIARKHLGERKRILLLIDEAQNLPARSIEELRMLANFQVGGRSLFQTVLLGQDELRRTLEGPGMEQHRQRIVASYHLEPLAESEVQDYVEYRLKQVGWSRDPSLDHGVFGGIFALTDGVPRRINRLCDRLFLYGCIEEKHALGPIELAAVEAEMKSEMGQVERRQSEVRSAPDSEHADTGTESADAQEATLSERLRSLETEVRALRQIVLHERKLLRKAVLLQLDLDAYDDID